MPKYVIADGVLERCPPDPRLAECPDAGRWNIGDESTQRLAHPSSHYGQQWEPLTGTRKRAMILDTE